jgi:hypothetical protein
MIKKISNYLSILAIFFMLTFCADKDRLTGKDVLKEPNIFKKVEEDAKAGKGLLKGGISGVISRDTTYNFGTSNVLWRSTLKTLDFMPFQTVDYSGGVIITDWHSNGNDNKQIKFTINFLSDKLATESVNVNGFIKECNQNKCTTTKTSPELNTKIKFEILEYARTLSIEDTKKSKE